MPQLRFVGVEDHQLILTSVAGERFTVPIDDDLRSALRPRPAANPSAPRVAPREIQQRIRAGRTVDEVVAETGADRAQVERFEGPILAERRYTVEQARAVPVRLEHDDDPLAAEQVTFGEAIDRRLERLDAASIRWDAWKEPESEWHIGLDFDAEGVTRNALWAFDARTRALQPLSPAAITLSQQGDGPVRSGPHLRPVQSEDAAEAHPTAANGPFDGAEAEEATKNETADLLEALRRRRGVRDLAPMVEDDDEHASEHDPIPWPGSASSTAPDPSATGIEHLDDEDASDGVRPDSGAAGAGSNDPGRARPNGSDAHPAGTGAISVVPESLRRDSADAGTPTSAPPSDDDASPEPQRDRRTGPTPKAPRRRGDRPTMPSWDEIVFGTKPEDS